MIRPQSAASANLSFRLPTAGFIGQTVRRRGSTNIASRKTKVLRPCRMHNAIQGGTHDSFEENASSCMLIQAAVSSMKAEATEAARRILQTGGNAFDAVVGGQAALAVTDFALNGIRLERRP